MIFVLSVDTGSVDGHVLALLGAAPSGIFTHDAWVITAPRQFDDIAMVLASAHEAHHAALNASTAWGAVLQAVSLAARSTGQPPQQNLLRDLVAVSTRTHEAYATHCGVLDVIRAGGADDAGELLAPYPGYDAHLARAARLGPPTALRNTWGHVVVESALQACMQSTAMRTLAEVGLHRFSLASTRRIDHPDRRLALLASTGQRWWHEAEAGLAEVFGDRWDELRSLDIRDPLSRAAEQEGIWTALRRLCLRMAGDALRRAGSESLSVEQVSELYQPLMDDVDRFTGGRLHLTLDLQTDSGVSGLFEMEAVRTGLQHPARVTASPAITAYGEGDNQHGYVMVRSGRALRERFALDGTFPDDDSPIVVLQSPGEGGVTYLTPVRHPQDLAAMAAVLQAPVFASVSQDCTLNQTWRAAWSAALHQNTMVTLLFDVPVTQSLDALLGSGEPFAYTLITVGAGADRRTVFACRLGDDPPLLLPCGLTAGQALVNYVHRRSEGQLYPDPGATSSHATAIRHVVPHLVDEEQAVGNLTRRRP